MVITQSQALFIDLAMPFDDWEVKSMERGTTMILFVSATTVMNRLDEVVGPASWTASYQQLARGIQCKLTITLPSGEQVAREDCGGYHGMNDPGDDEKSGFSDALKRAAMNFGVGRYLWQNGVPAFAREAFNAAVCDRKLLHCGYREPSPKSVTATPHKAIAATSSSEPKNDEPSSNYRSLLYWLKNESTELNWDLTSYLTTEWSLSKGYPKLLNKWTPDQLALGYKEAQRKSSVVRKQSQLAIASN